MAPKRDTPAAPLTCPHDGSELRPTPARDKRAIVRDMVAAGSSPAYAQNFADTHHEKEAALGVVHVCPSCRYVTRVKDAA